MKVRHRYSLISCLVAVSFSTSVTAETVVNFGAGAGFAGLPMMIMDHLDLLEKHGKAAGLDLKANYPRFSGTSANQDAILSGSVDFVMYGASALITIWSRAKNSPHQVIGVSGITTLTVHLVTNKKELKSIADFTPSDKIAVTGLASPQVLMLQQFSEKTFGAGQHSKLKSNLVALPHSESVSAMLSGGTEVKAYFAPPPFTQILLDSGKVSTITTSVEMMGGPASLLILSASRRYLEANPAIAEVAVKAMREATDVIKKDPKRAAEIYLTMEPSRTLDHKQVETILRQIGPEFGPEVSGMRVWADIMQKVGLIKEGPADLKDLFWRTLPEAHLN
jgi:NitT/TauT family transport system substrate-binding protein